MFFLVDAMLGNLARWLRIFGHDVLFANDFEGQSGGGPSDTELLQMATEENRILVTRDKQFASRLPGAIFVWGTELLDALRAVQDALGLVLHFDQDLARCTQCNTPLQRVENKDTVKDAVPAKTYERYDEFWACPNPACGKIFWQGSHFEDIHAIEAQLRISKTES